MTRCLDWVSKGFGHAQSETPPADFLEEKARTGLDLFWSSSEDVDLGIEYVFVRTGLWGMPDRSSEPCGDISSLPTDLSRFCLLSYKSVSSVAAPL